MGSFRLSKIHGDALIKQWDLFDEVKSMKMPSLKFKTMGSFRLSKIREDALIKV